MGYMGHKNDPLSALLLTLSIKGASVGGYLRAAKFANCASTNYIV